MNRLSTKAISVIALWCAATFSILLWLDWGRISPIAGTQLLHSGWICQDETCTQRSPITLPWFSLVALRADNVSVSVSIPFTVSEAQSRPLAVYIPKLADGVTLRLNEVEIYHSPPSHRLWNTPLLVPVNSAFLIPSVNTLNIELRGRLAEGLDLWPLYVGPEELLHPSWALRTYIGPEMARLAMALMVVLGGALMAFWTTQRHERAFLWLGLSCFCACIFLAHFGLPADILPYKAWTALWLHSIGFYVFLIMQFEFALLRLSYPRLAQIFLATLAVGAVAIGLAPVDYTFHLAFAFNLVTAIFAFIILCIIYTHRVLIGKLDFAIFFLCLSSSMVLGLYGLTVHLMPSPPRPLHLFQFTPILMMLACLWLIIGRAIQAVRSQAKTVADQSRIIEEKSAELRNSFARLAEADKMEAAAKERARMTSDLHDGIGSHLVSTLSYARDKDVEDHTLINALEDALRELSLLVDSVGNDGDVVSLLGMLRLRLEGLLARNGLQFDWQIENDPNVDHLDGTAGLHIARIVQEAINNVIKHSGASTITVHADHTSISVTDNGTGFDVDAPKSAGYGLQSMQYRAKQAGISLSLSSTADGASVRLDL